MKNGWLKIFDFWTYASVEGPWSNDEAVEDGLDLGHKVGDGRLLSLRRGHILVTFYEGLEPLK